MKGFIAALCIIAGYILGTIVGWQYCNRQNKIASDNTTEFRSSHSVGMYYDSGGDERLIYVFDIEQPSYVMLVDSNDNIVSYRGDYNEK